MMAGYYRDAAETAKAIDTEGWLHTGDVATIDPDGYVRIVDRLKELIITSGGKNLSPANIEGLIKASPLVGQACAIGDRRPFVTALVVLDTEYAAAWARRRGLSMTSAEQLSHHPEVVNEIARAVAAANGHLARVEQVKRFKILPASWTAES